MQIHILTLFPEMFQGPFDQSIVKRAVDKGAVDIRLHNIRDYTHDRHRTVDDYQFGGDSGMVMKPEPIFEGVETILSGITQLEMATTRVILTSPQGKLLNQKMVEEFCPATIPDCPVRSLRGGGRAGAGASDYRRR